MKSLNRRLIAVGFSLLAVGFAGLSSVSQPAAPATSNEIVIDGSSTVAPITQAVASEFKDIRSDVRISVGVSGTSGGFSRFLAKETDIADASRPIKTAEIDKATQEKIDYIESLVAFDGLTVAVDNNTQIFKGGSACMTVGELNLLWGSESDGVITHWSQLGSRFVNDKIALSGAAETSGTFDFFTEAVNGRTGDTRGDYFGTEEDQLLAEQTGQNPLALTYFGYAFFLNNQQIVQAVAIDPRKDLIDAPQSVLNTINAKRATNNKAGLTNGGGTCTGILPSLDTILSFQYSPLSRPLFIYTNAASAQRETVDAFVDFYLSEEIIGNDEFIQDVGYVNAPEGIREAARACWDDRITGTAFGGQISGEAKSDLISFYRKHCGL